MTPFKKYPSIENSYQEKFVHIALSMHPELETCKYILQEKLHGSNFQVCISKNGDIKYGKRSTFLEEKSNFYNYQEVVFSMLDLFRKVGINPYIPFTDSITLYGELFGAGVQKGVDYGKDKRLLFYDLSIDGTLCPPALLYHLFDNLQMTEYLVPKITVVDSLKNAMDYNVEFDSKILDIPNNICEGVVIKPYHKVYFLGMSLFYLKKKNDKFVEKQKEKRIKGEFHGVVLGLNRLFVGYCNENRMNSIFSKEGPIQDIKEIGKYIKLVQEDAKEDFIKDHSEELEKITDEKQKNRIFNAGHIIVRYLRKHI